VLYRKQRRSEVTAPILLIPPKWRSLLPKIYVITPQKTTHAACRSPWKSVLHNVFCKDSEASTRSTVCELKTWERLCHCLRLQVVTAHLTHYFSLLSVMTPHASTGDSSNNHRERPCCLLGSVHRTSKQKEGHSLSQETQISSSSGQCTYLSLTSKYRFFVWAEIAQSIKRLATGSTIESLPQSLRGLRRGSAADRLLGFRVRIPPEAQMFVLCVA
jgi:hypothetical protein